MHRAETENPPTLQEYNNSNKRWLVVVRHLGMRAQVNNQSTQNIKCSSIILHIVQRLIVL